MIDQLVGPWDEVGVDRQGAPFCVNCSCHNRDAPMTKRPFDYPGVTRVEPGRHRGILRGLEHPVFEKIRAGQRWMIPLPQWRQRRPDERARGRMSDRLPTLAIAPDHAE